KPLLERRLKAGPWHEKEWSQKIIVSLVFAAFLAFIVLPILDYRYSLSRVPAWISLVGNAIIIFSFLAIFWVIKTNSWAASNIRVEADQKVIDTGPYAHVRHPMYAGAIWLFVGIPLALGSWWSVALLIPFFPVLLWRLLDEEKILVRDLPGYTEYMQKVKYRLIPHVWVTIGPRGAYRVLGSEGTRNRCKPAISVAKGVSNVTTIAAHKIKGSPVAYMCRTAVGLPPPSPMDDHRVSVRRERMVQREHG